MPQKFIENDRRGVKSKAISPRAKRRSEEEPFITTASKEDFLND
jgi:hypothetical protein